MWSSRRARPEGPPRSRHLGLRLLLIAAVVLLCLYVLPTPWAFHMGGKFSPVGEWSGYGPVQAGNGGRYLLYTQLRGGIVNNHGHRGCGFPRCDALSGSAQLCAQSGRHSSFGLTGAVHAWYTTNGARTDISLTGSVRNRPPAGVASFHGIWHGAVLPLTGTGGTHATLRPGSVGGFDRACRALAGHPH